MRIGCLVSVLLVSTATVAHAVTPITGCQALTKAGEVYRLTEDVEPGAGTCLVIAANGITLDLGGHGLFGAGVGTGVGEAGPHLNTTIKNGEIFSLGRGIVMPLSASTTVRSVNSNNHALGSGLVLGAHALVQNVEAFANEGTGVQAGDFLTVRDSDIGINLLEAVSAGAHAFITHSQLHGSRETGGVLVGAQSVVTANAIRFNLDGGVVAGVKSQIASNAFTGNDGVDITTVCPGTITNNVSLDNDPLSIQTTGTGCQVTGNRQPLP